MAKEFIYAPSREFGQSQGRERLTSGTTPGSGIEYISRKYGFCQWVWGGGGAPTFNTDPTFYRRFRRRVDFTSGDLAGSFGEMIIDCASNGYQDSYTSHWVGGMTRTDVRVNVGGVVSPSATSSTRLTNYTILTSPFHTGACTEVDSVEQPESFDVQTYEAWTRALAVENKRWPFSIYGSAAYTVFDQGFILHQDPGTSYLQSGPSTETGGSFSTKIRGVSPINSTRPSAFSSYSIETRFNPVTSNDLEIPPWLTQSGLFWNGVTSISIGIPGIPNGTSAHLFTASIHDFGDAAQTEEECLLNYAISDGKLRPLGPQSITNPATGIPALLMLAPRPSRPISVGLGPNNSLVNRTSYFTSIPGCVPEPNSGHTITIAPSCF